MQNLFGSIQRSNETSTIVMRRTIKTSPQDAWDAIVTPQRCARWLGAVSGDLQPGGKYRITFDDSDPTALVEGEVLRCIPASELVVTWQAPGDEPSQVTVVLLPAGDSTELLLTHSGLRATSSDTGHAAGWQVYLDQLAAGLEVNDWSDRWSAWGDLKRAYEAVAGMQKDD